MASCWLMYISCLNCKPFKSIIWINENITVFVLVIVYLIFELLTNKNIIQNKEKITGLVLVIAYFIFELLPLKHINLINGKITGPALGLYISFFNCYHLNISSWLTKKYQWPHFCYCIFHFWIVNQLKLLRQSVIDPALIWILSFLIL